MDSPREEVLESFRPNGARKSCAGRRSGTPDLDRYRRTILRLILFGFVYNVAEGILCVGAGLAAGSIVLVGFGLDSGIEAAAALAAWRFLRGEMTEATGKEGHSKWVLGNCYLEQHYEGTFMGQPFSGVGYTGYDNVTKKYVVSWMDTSSTGIMSMPGKSDATGKVLSFSGTVFDPMTGKPCKITQKITITDNDHHTFEMWGPDPTGKNYKMMEASYTRKK